MKDARGLFRDLMSLAGLGLVGYGCWLAWPPAGFIVPGLLMLSLAVFGELVSSGRFRRVDLEPK